MKRNETTKQLLDGIRGRFFASSIGRHHYSEASLDCPRGTVSAADTNIRDARGRPVIRRCKSKAAQAARYLSCTGLLPLLASRRGTYRLFGPALPALDTHTSSQLSPLSTSLGNRSGPYPHLRRAARSLPGHE